MNQHKKQSIQKDNPNQSHLQIDQSSSSSSEYSSIDQQQLNFVCKTVRKLHKIQKRGELVAFKQKFKQGNELFAEMSAFFHQKQRKRDTLRKSKREERMRLREVHARKTIKYNSQQLYTQLKDLDKEAQQYQNKPAQAKQHIIHEHQCHICKVSFAQVHHFYQDLCPACASFNWNKRTQSKDLKPITALVTGGRIKIGFETAIKLLRDGATVYVTSRFANDCLLRYQQQSDYSNWKSRLHIVQCDFLSQSQVSSLINHIKTNVNKLDILINNAAQTIIRPKQFYSKQLENQRLTLEFPNQMPQNQIQKAGAINFKQMYSSVYSNQITIKPEEIDLISCDQFGQPLDKRKINTWVQKIQDVSLLDCYTTQIVNSVVPFHLISQLKDKMIGTTPSWVINVSSMEGVFYRPGKQQFHPHTNMAKAALNMITRTTAQDFKLSNIYMNSVDTGWITNQNPFDIAQQIAKRHGFKCPLDCIDGAMRILDPIYLGLIHNQFPFGQFIKNYQSSFW